MNNLPCSDLGFSDRVTKPMIDHRVKLLRERGLDITVSYQLGRARCYSKGESKELSPRLSKREMWYWLDGFEAGLGFLEQGDQPHCGRCGADLIEANRSCPKCDGQHD